MSSNNNELSIREMFHMGLFNIQPQSVVTQSGRVSKLPKLYSQEKYPNGAGCCPRQGMEETDMSYNGHCD